MGKRKRRREGEGRSEVKCPEIYLSPPGNPSERINYNGEINV